jgi:protein-disulfide isomerase
VLTVILLLAAACVAIDLALLAVMAFVIHSFCLVCLFTYAVNLLMLITSAASLGVPWTSAAQRIGTALAAVRPSRQRPATWLLWGLLVAAVSSACALEATATFVSRGAAAEANTQMRQFIVTQPRVTVPSGDDPTIGPADAPLRIVEFSDFFCPSCQRAAKVNVVILANHRHDVSFTFKHFPLDQECNSSVTRQVHPGACRVAAASECAHRQGRFWAFHDLVLEAFHDGASYNLAHLEADAQRVGLEMMGFRACLASGEGMEAVKRDIAAGIQATIRSTPTYVVNGVAVTGGFTPSSFEAFIAILMETGDR